MYFILIKSIKTKMTETPHWKHTARMIGLPLDSTSEDISNAVMERSRKHTAMMIGLPVDATPDQVSDKNMEMIRELPATKLPCETMTGTPAGCSDCES